MTSISINSTNITNIFVQILQLLPSDLGKIESFQPEGSCIPRWFSSEEQQPLEVDNLVFTWYEDNN
jgi:hypothetical protein